MKATAAELAVKMNVDKPIAYGLLRYLEAIGKAKAVGSIPANSSDGRGRSSTVYEFAKNCCIVF